MKVAPELAHVGIVTIEDGDAGSGQALHQLIFGARNAGHAIGKILGVGTADVGDDPPIGVSDASQRSDFAGMRHPHLDHGNLMLRLQFEQLQGHAEFVVEVSMRFQNREARSQNFRNRLFGGGLAGAASHPDHALVPMPAHRGGQRLQRDQRIVHDQQSVGMRPGREDRLLCCGRRPPRELLAPARRRQSHEHRNAHRGWRKTGLPAPACGCRWNIPSPAAPRGSPSRGLSSAPIQPAMSCSCSFIRLLPGPAIPAARWPHHRTVSPDRRWSVFFRVLCRPEAPGHPARA